MKTHRLILVLGAMLVLAVVSPGTGSAQVKPRAREPWLTMALPTQNSGTTSR